MEASPANTESNTESDKGSHPPAMTQPAPTAALSQKRLPMGAEYDPTRDDSPNPVNYTIAVYREMEEDIKESIKNTESCDDTPVLIAQISAVYEGADDNIKDAVEKSPTAGQNPPIASLEYEQYINDYPMPAAEYGQNPPITIQRQAVAWIRPPPQSVLSTLNNKGTRKSSVPFSHSIGHTC